MDEHLNAMSWHNLFLSALSALLHEVPPVSMVEQWFAGTSTDLQKWCIANKRQSWYTGTSIINAAHALAQGYYENAK